LNVKVTRGGFAVLAFSIAVLSITARYRRSPGDPEPPLTFVQLADAHLFDRGWRTSPRTASRPNANNWDALHWSIERINALAASGKNIDFVAYTGVMSLESAGFKGQDACSEVDLPTRPHSPEIPEDSASVELLSELDRLTVRTIFFISGNNDTAAEETSGGRCDCFLLALQKRAQALTRPLRIQKLDRDHCFALKGFHLLRLDSTQTPPSGFSRLRQLVSSDAPTLLFAHVLDPSGEEPEFRLNTNIRREWENEARKSNVLGIFAGHLPGSVRDSGHEGISARVLGLEPQAAAKTYFAPPLAPEDSRGTGSVSGFLIVTATRSGIISREFQWFGPGIR
jgi:hypothetical protein